ncbi:putative GMC oxidoreductase [Xylariomycetidae sp. FL2044]|nr:putative GMC oxidoreductase [Xylariomycetidae sp. FL2044]
MIAMKTTTALLMLASSISASCEAFDYVIVGAGTCGLVVANRLSEDPSVQVAVLEPGGDVRDNPNVTDVNGFATAFDTPIDWQYSTTPQSGASGRVIEWHSGKAIGGTSTINGMTYVRGDKAQFDAWESLGNEGWNWETLYPYYKKAEQFSAPTEAQIAAGASYEPGYHGEEGPVTTGYPFSMLNGTFHETVQKAWEALGYAKIPDVNGGDVRGFSLWPQTLDRDKNVRQDAARAYFYPVEDRPNLKIIRGAATKVTWADREAHDAAVVAEGVEYINAYGRVVSITASREVILSAGALISPLILEASGVGSRSILSGLGIETIVDLPGVGSNLQDQPLGLLNFNTTANLTGSTPYATFANAKDLFGDDKAAVASSTEAQLPQWAAVVSEANNGSVTPEAIEQVFRVQHDLIFNKNITIGESLTVASLGPSLLSSFWILLPFSWGSVHLKSPDAVNSPPIDPKYLLIDFDLEILTRVGRLSQDLWYTEPLADLVVAPTSPDEATLPRNATYAQWKGFFEDNLMPNHHALGTAAMMSRSLGGVVDPKLKVYGTSNVRVVDASVIPMQISGHLTATLYAMAERASDIIKAS